jgi:hypothetical protein
VGPVRSYRVDPRREYLARRLQGALDDGLEVTEIEYEPHPAGGWAPKSWTRTRTRGRGKLAERARAEVTEVRVGGPVPEETFRLDPAPGEIVSETETQKYFRVRDDGGLDELDPVTWQNRAPAEGGPPAWAARPVVRFVALPALLLFVLGLVLWRARRRPPNTPTA